MSQLEVGGYLSAIIIIVVIIITTNITSTQSLYW